MGNAEEDVVDVFLWHSLRLELDEVTEDEDGGVAGDALLGNTARYAWLRRLMETFPQQGGLARRDVHAAAPFVVSRRPPLARRCCAQSAQHKKKQRKRKSETRAGRYAALSASRRWKMAGQADTQAAVRARDRVERRRAVQRRAALRDLRDAADEVVVARGREQGAVLELASVPPRPA
jgi:hypothetical protein